MKTPEIKLSTDSVNGNVRAEFLNKAGARGLLHIGMDPAGKDHGDPGRTKLHIEGIGQKVGFLHQSNKAPQWEKKK